MSKILKTLSVTEDFFSWERTHSVGHTEYYKMSVGERKEIKYQNLKMLLLEKDYFLFF